MTKSALEKEFDFYVKNQDALADEYEGRFIVIKDCQVIGAYESEVEAVEKTSEEHPLGTFLVQKCERGEDSYTQTFHSRVMFCGT